MKKFNNVFVVISLVISMIFSRGIVKTKEWRPYFAFKKGETTYMQCETSEIIATGYKNTCSSFRYDIAIYDKKSDSILFQISDSLFGSPQRGIDIRLNWETQKFKHEIYYLICIPSYYDYDQDTWKGAEDNNEIWSIVIEDPKYYAQQVVFPSELVVVDLNETIQLSATVLPTHEKSHLLLV